MPASVPIALSLLLELVSILSSTHGQNVGQSCVVDNSPGVCKILEDCPTVYAELLAGKNLNKTCISEGFDPIVCCPTNTVVTTPTPRPTPQIIQTTTKRIIFDRSQNGSLARAKCAESADAVFVFETPKTSSLDKKPFKMSLCALKSPRKLIIGGQKAEAKEFPHMAAVGFDISDEIRWSCGGTLLSKKVVLTAAHCTWTQDWGYANWVRVGDLNLKKTNDDAMPQTVAVSERIKHPDYKYPSAYHDIAILRLAVEVNYTAYVRPACLPVNWPDIGQNDKAVATGWGHVELFGNGSENLLKVTLNLVSHASCNSSFSNYLVANSLQQLLLPSGVIDKWQICAGQYRNDTCQGDSGGPLAVFNDDHDCMYTVIGVTSHGISCGIIPGMYTRVYNYIPWIERTAWPEYFE